MAEFTARYPGACAYGDRIHEGDLCRYVDREIAHVECAEVDGAVVNTAARAETVCPACQLAHRGDCF